MLKIKMPTKNFIQVLFEKEIPLRMKFLCSGMKNSDLPASTVPEIALVGRSNVGKSSLLNFIAGQKQLARVSRTPGRTQTINLFSLEDEQFMFVDLPGFGYAESSREVQAHWQKGMQEFFEQREGLFAVLFLFDIRRKIGQEDRDLSLWLQEMGFKVVGIQTKCDKVNKRQWQELTLQHANDLGLTPAQIITTSTIQKMGLKNINQMIAGLLDTLSHDLGTHK